MQARVVTVAQDGTKSFGECADRQLFEDVAQPVAEVGERKDDATEDEQQEVDEVGGGERRLGAKGPGEQ